MRATSRLACVMALAINACAVDGGDHPPPAPLASSAPQRAPAGEEAGPRAPAAPASASLDPRTHDAIAADLSQSGEPMIAVAGWRDETGAPGVPVYAQRNGGWRRLTTSQWPAGESSFVRAVEAADLDGDGRLELIALGRTGADDGGLATLAVFRMRDGDLELVADTHWTGGGDRVWVPGGAGDRGEIVVGGRNRRALRSFALDGERLVPGGTPMAAPPAPGDEVTMTLPGPCGAIRVAVRDAGSGRPLLATIAKWNAELARLRPRKVE